MEVPIDFNNRRALILDGGDGSRFTFTTVQDLANVVARAIDFTNEWPVIGGIKGAELSMGEIISLGEKIRGSYAQYGPIVMHRCGLLTVNVTRCTL
jgi:hypothetical protein